VGELHFRGIAGHRRGEVSFGSGTAA
jgi:hypothetical protein